MAASIPSVTDPGLDADQDSPLLQRGAFSVSQWCRYRGICPATFYNHLRRGEMPAVVKIGRRTIITAEADAEWRRRMERPSVAEAPLKTLDRVPRGRPRGLRNKFLDQHAA